MTFRLIFVSLGLALSTHAAPSVAPLWAGMPDTLAPDFLKQRAFVNYERSHSLNPETPFSQTRDTFKVFPGGLKAPLTSPEAFQTVRQDHWVYFPGSSAIEHETSIKGEEIWLYPQGLELVHRFMDSNGRPFLIRVATYKGDDVWRFGAYELDRAKNVWVLLKNLTPENRTVSFNDSSFGPVRVSFQLIPSQRCTVCHSKRGQN